MKRSILSLAFLFAMLASFAQSDRYAGYAGKALNYLIQQNQSLTCRAFLTHL